MEFYIVNDCDRPCPKLVAYEKDGLLYYLIPNPVIKSGMSKEHATPLLEFGITAEHVPGGILFNKTSFSVAQYRNGKHRKWQGCEEFILPDPEWSWR